MARREPVILIVEDEFLLSLDSAETIEHAGFEVVQAANADHAIARWFHLQRGKAHLSV